MAMSANLNVNQLLPSSGTVSGSGTSKQFQTQNLLFDPAIKAALDAAITDEEYSKDAAMRDAAGLSDAVMKRLLETQMPSISTADRTTGGYSNTTTEMLRNDLTARTGAAGQQVVLDTIAKYAAINQGKIGALTGAVNATTGRTATGETTSTSEQTTESEGQIADTIGMVGQGPIGMLGGAKAVNTGTVICTQLYRDGHLTYQEYIADISYARLKFKWETINGYRFYAVPFVKLMRRNRAAYMLGYFIGKPWSEHCAGYWNPIAALTYMVAVPICYITGKFIEPVPYSQLWSEA